MTDIHWHAIHNVSGYLPEQDENPALPWEDARAALAGDIEHERDALDYAPGEDPRTDALDASLAEALAGVRAATPGQDFLIYTDDGESHTIPTAWQITACTESECEPIE